MKIKFDIQEKYTEPEIHLCSREKNREILELYETLENLLDVKIKGYRQQEVKVLAVSEIVRIYSSNKKVYVRNKEECYEVRERLYTLEEQLAEKGFVRISNSEIVNVQQITKLDMGYSGTIKMYLKNGDETYVSRRYVRKMKEMLG